MSRRFIVIHEATADFITATELADRVLVEQIDWLDETLLVHGHFAGEPGLPDAHAARRAIALVLKQLGEVDAIVLVRDADDQIERRQGLEQARRAYAAHCKLVIGLALREREAWVICGFQPQDETETARLAGVIQELGWNPCRQPERLTAGKDNNAIKSPKRVLAALTGNDRHRERDCWLSTPLETLRERGGHNGLFAYLTEVNTELVRLISGYDRQKSKPSA